MTYSASIRLRQSERALDKCPRCGKRSMAQDSESGEVYCTNCGFVVKEKMEETGPEWRSFSDDEKGDRARTGAPLTITAHDMGLATVIGRANRDASGRALTGQTRSSVERMRLWDSRSQANESRDRNLRQALGKLRMFAEKLGLSQDVVERGSYIYRKVLDRDLLRGRSISHLSAASLYAACREMEVPRTLKDVATVSNVKRKEIAKAYRLLIREMDIKMPVPNPLRMVSRIASGAKMSERTKRRALEILGAAERNGVSAGKDPMGLAAAALYVAATLEGATTTQKDIAQAANVTEVTVRNRYKNLKAALGI
jgi:transcription initiation factor TFIIB